MSVRRVAILLGKDFKYGSKGFIFIMAIVAPILISLVLNLVFGTFFSQTAKLGINDQGNSRLVDLVSASDSVQTRTYASADDLRKAVEVGAVDMGVSLPDNFDEDALSGNSIVLPAYVWGESLAKNRGILLASINSAVRQLAGQEVPVQIETTTLGDAQSVPWSDRLLPFVLLYAVTIGGTMVPASLIVDEKQKRTLTALAITPTTLGDILAAKGLMGVILALVMSIVILLMNQAFGVQTGLLMIVLGLGAVLAALFGLVLGALVKDINTLFATIKGIGILLYAPVFVYMFPQIPQWIGNIFPTYYIIQPVVEISQRGGTWSDIVFEVSILAGLIVLMLVVVTFSTRRLKQQEA
ncbi:MAG TPA: ABC transporter permease [Dehalococcoidales bacterium]|nr:ABC transporter permease [Dehalococcoidales bacterium]